GSCGLAYRAEGVDVEGGAADERAVDVRLLEQARGVVGLDRAAIEDGDVEERLDERVRRLGQLRRRGPAGADRPDGLVGDDEPLVGLEDGDLAAEHVLGLVRLALLERLADAGDDVEAGLERGGGAPRHAVVGLPEQLPPLGVADERAGDAELEEHRRRDLAGEGAFRLPVDVLRVRRQAGVDAVPEPREGRADDRVEAGERPRVGPVEHLPVAGDDHEGIAATPGSSFPSSSSRLAPPPVESHETRSARPSSLRARTETAPPTTENAASLPATASATAFVPSAKRGHSKTPIGPFQKIVRASASASAKRARVSGPMSRPSHPSGSSSNPQTHVSASASNAAAPTTSTGSSTRKSSGFSSRSSSAILPPIRTVSARPPRLRRTPSLSSTFAPPETMTKGCSTSPSRRPRCSSSSRRSRPALAGSRCATASVEACARCAEPNASFT